jgi:NAD(P)-dependent dehydrogenase (short-subunit alcohol dehydrogenase family)
MSRVAVVTGAASGIGFALSTALAERGDTVVMTDVNGDQLESSAAVLAGRGLSVSSTVLDVRVPGDVSALVHRVSDEHGRLDLIFNNAGVGVGGETDQLSATHWDRIIDINLKGVVNGVSAAYPLMLKQRFGHIVNTASLAGLVPATFMAPYVMTKHAVVALTLSLRAEAARYGVGVTALCPGVVDTPFFGKGAAADLPRSRLSNAIESEKNAKGRAVAQKVVRGYPPAQLAQDALEAVTRNEALVIVPRLARAQWRAQRFAPGLLNSVRTLACRRFLATIQTSEASQTTP